MKASFEEQVKNLLVDSKFSKNLEIKLAHFFKKFNKHFNKWNMLKKEGELTKQILIYELYCIIYKMGANYLRQDSLSIINNKIINNKKIFQNQKLIESFIRCNINECFLVEKILLKGDQEKFSLLFF